MATAFAAATIVALLGWAGPAAGHSDLRATDPPADTTTAGVVDRLVLEFAKSISVLPESIEVTDDTGATWASSPSVAPDGMTVTAVLEAALPTGDYTVFWRVIGGDGHPIEGSYAIAVVAIEAPASDPPTPEPIAQQPTESIGVPATQTTATPQTMATPPPTPALQPTPHSTDMAVAVPTQATSAPPPLDETQTTAGITRVRPSTALPEVVEVVSRWLAFTGILTAIGVVIFAIAVHPDSPADQAILSQLATGAAGIAMAATASQFIAHVAVVSGRGMGGMGDGDAWAIVADGGMFTAAALRILACALIIVTMTLAADWSHEHAQSFPVIVGVVTLLVSFQFTGHTASSEPSMVVRIADFSHVAAAALWTGGVLALGAIIRARHQRQDDSTLVVGRFSVVATFSVVLVGLAGAVLAFIELRSITTLFTSGYGQVLLSKLAIVALIGGAGAYNHTRLVPAVVHGHPGAGLRMQRMMRLELGLFPVAIALTAVLVRLSP